MCIAFLIYLQSSSAEAFCSYVNMYQIKEASSFILCIFATIALHWLCPRCLVEVERSRRRPGDQSPLTLTASVDSALESLSGRHLLLAAPR